MDKLEQNLNNIVKNIKGSFLGIGINFDSTLNLIEKNKNITFCELLDSESKAKTNIKRRIFKKNKIIEIKKIKKRYKKKSIDNFIVNYEVLINHFNTIFHDSIYLCREKMYIYNVTDKDVIIRNFSKYNVDVVSKNNILIADIGNIKTNFWKRIRIKFIIFIERLVMYITEYLTM